MFCLYHTVFIELLKNKIFQVPVTVQQQILQTINPQQLQNIKNVTLLRARPSPNLGLTPIVTLAPSTSADQHTNIVTVAVSKQDQILGQPGVQIKTSGNLTPAQQQQILQTIKQKILPNASVLTSQQQIILKQKGAVLPTALAGSAKIIGQQKLTTTGKWTFELLVLICQPNQVKNRTSKVL